MVSTALFTGLSGLRIHQTYIDVIGNNLANVSTPGFRGSRATFSDILSFTVRSGSGPSGNFGGVNPIQIGHGATMATIDTDLNQGTFQDTGRPMDIALQGRGFFTLSDGVQSFYSRVGSFGIDANRTLVDLRSGMQVMSASGNKITVPFSDTLPAQASSEITFQGNLPAEVGGPLEEIISSGESYLSGTAAATMATGTAGTGTQFDINATTFPSPTVLVSINGQAQISISLPNGVVNASDIAAEFSAVTGLEVTADDLNGTIQFDTTRLGQGATLKFDDGPGSTGLLSALDLDAQLTTGTEATATLGTDLASMTARIKAYQAGDGITISGTNPDGTLFSDTFVYGTDGTTLGDMINWMNGSAPFTSSVIDPLQASVSLTPDGNIRMVATDKAEASMSLRINDAQNEGRGNVWPDFAVSQNGTGPDTAVTSIDVVDSQGRTHPITLTFTRSAADPTSWDLVADIDENEGTINQGSIGQIRFNNNGSFSVIGGGSNTLQFTWDGITEAQTVAVNLGSSGEFDGVAMLGNASTVAATDQDGYTAGTLLSTGFNQLGDLEGYFTNGQSRIVDTLRLTMFSNEGGLMKVGNTMWIESPNSGDAINTTASSAGAGSVRAGQLENSNVDIAREFVNLIEAQRGFQANSRVITTTDEILAELMNIVR